MFHQYTVRVPADKRAGIQRALDAAGIATQIYYPIPNHALPMYAKEGRSLPETEAAAREVLSLPIYPELASEDAEQIANKLAAALR